MTKGWTRRFVASPERAAEAIELYRLMGLEVRTEKPAAEDFNDGCSGCAETGCRTDLVIYTRPLPRKK